MPVWYRNIRMEPLGDQGESRGRRVSRITRRGGDAESIVSCESPHLRVPVSPRLRVPRLRSRSKARRGQESSATHSPHPNPLPEEGDRSSAIYLQESCYFLSADFLTRALSS